ncbi:hypothetical protein JXM83_04530 [Candidatus Woesearchaeota archaeon]|nr:hypothetical protein [Candidatus Woesearchaeota archaeon]
MNLFQKTKQKTVPLKEFEEMKKFLLAQIQTKNRVIEQLKKEKQIIMNMAFKSSEQKLNKSKKETKKDAR